VGSLNGLKGPWKYIYKNIYVTYMYSISKWSKTTIGSMNRLTCYCMRIRSTLVDSMNARRRRRRWPSASISWKKNYARSVQRK
jgi:hypothetical protein